MMWGKKTRSAKPGTLICLLNQKHSISRQAKGFWGLILLLLTLVVLIPPRAWGVQAPGKIIVVASIIPLGDFCQNLGRERVQVEVLVPPGASPHIFEPPPSVIGTVKQAQVLVYVGAGLDPWVKRLLDSRAPGNLVVVEAVQAIALLSQGDSHPHEQGNPHVWLDPVLAKSICQDIAQALITTDPSHRQYYEANLINYLHRLEELHKDIKNTVASFSHRQYVCFHPAFTYFAQRYNLQEVGVIETAPGREPSPRQIRNIIDAIHRYKMRAIFAEAQLSPRLAQVIAREAGVQVLLLDPLGGRPPYGTDYLALMRYNLSIMAQALR